jgi:hypothetical protein
VGRKKSLFQIIEIGKRTMNGAFLLYKLISDVAYPLTLGFIPCSKVRKMDCLERRPIGISYNLVFKWL